MTQLILASGSEARIGMLKRARVTFEVAPARVDEDAIRTALKAEGASPRDIADALAEAKALKVSARHPSALVIGADQVLDLDGNTMSKPSSAQEMRAQLQQLRGRRHSLFSAVVVAEEGKAVWREVREARLHVRELSDAWLEGYVARNWPSASGSVGGYLIEDEGIRLFDRVDGDTFTIMGLPLVPLLSWLTLRGSIPG